MKIAYDATTLRPKQTGVGYYTEHLLHSLLEIVPENLVLVSNQSIRTSLPLLPSARVWPKHKFPMCSVWMQLRAPFALQEMAPSLAHFTNSTTPVRKVVPYVLTLHDMSLHRLPRYHPWQRLLTRPLVSLATRRADAVITVSEASRNEIEEDLGVPRSRLHVIYPAASPIFRPVEDRDHLERVRRKFGLGRRTILFVGTLEPRKNLPRMIEAFSRSRACREDGYLLLCVGDYGWGAHQLQGSLAEWGVGESVRLTGYVSLEDLPALHSLADFFIYPSLYEGFGLPVVEAMACGNPVAVASSSALLEVVQDAALKFDPRSVEEMIDAIDALAGDDSLRAEYGDRSRKRASCFSWDEAARKTLRVYRRIAN